MIALVATPFAGSRAVELAADTWRKKLLPVGEIDYKGRTIRFDRDYLEDLAASFSNGAYGQVPFQLADGDNKHNNDPERFRGEVVAMDVQPDGLYVTVRTTDAGSRLLETNPKLGVSARIVEDYRRADGQYFGVAVQHVLGTLDPRITALGAWEPSVEMSNAYDGIDCIIDLSSAAFDGEPAPEPGSEPDADLADLLDGYLTPDELEILQEHGEDALIEYLADKAHAGDQAAAQPEPSLNGHAFANDDLGQAIELAASQAAVRAAEDALPPARRDEDRIATALGRLQRGTYVPSTSQRALGFAAGYDGPADAGAGCSCGATAADGSTASRYHLAGCDTQAMSADDMAEVARSGLYDGIAREPAADSRGLGWADQYGRPMTLTGLIENATGQRLGDSPFETGRGRRELLVPQRTARFGDVDDPYDPGTELPDVTGLADALHLRTQTAASQREAGRQRQLTAMQRLRPAGSYGQAVDASESTRERAARMWQPAYPVQSGDEPVAGSLPAYTYGALAG